MAVYGLNLAEDQLRQDHPHLPTLPFFLLVAVMAVRGIDFSVELVPEPPNVEGTGESAVM